MSIWTAAQNGRLTEGVLQDFLERDPDLLNREDGSGITPLGYALLNGKARAVKCLLDNGADPDKPMGETTTFRDGRTPMYLATIANPPSPRIVQLLLEKKPATFDKPISASKNQTPLMAAIAGKSNPEIVKLLINAGASPEAQDDDGKTARDLADALSDFASKQKIKDALEPTLRKGGGRGGLRSYMTNWVARVLGKSRSWRALGPIFKSASRYFLNIAPPASFHPEEELETEKLETAEDFKNSLDNIVNDDGLGRFFPPGNTYVKEVAEKTASLKNDPNNLLNSPSQLKGLATMALYQPIIYCDDSGSMRGELWEKQAELVKRITGIATRADPNNRGLYFRLINEDLSFADNLDGDAILRTLGKIVPHGNTQLGTQLRKRILDPIIRRPLYAGTPLERPYLIMIITDGCPTLEPSDQLRNVILDCSQFLGDKGYRKDAVRFCLSQIGQNQEARDFMDKLVMDSEVLKVLHRTVELVDTRYDELRQNEAELEDWLLSMLLSPVQALNAE
ncbi:ankyrin repeat protein [Histoplasma capsulatum var. duboisii H88]|uniref:Ankyrin repeat protein n=1 Tax=Ajellomyces capsulatus (strain H88) TaxID=544711 RepID=A0A8A1LBH2_AJEC8|nr:ankyrin repeat protein [Histoplasma capsulatum var. duboisii H88]